MAWFACLGSVAQKRERQEVQQIRFGQPIAAQQRTPLVEKICLSSSRRKLIRSSEEGKPCAIPGQTPGMVQFGDIP